MAEDNYMFFGLKSEYAEFEAKNKRAEELKEPPPNEIVTNQGILKLSYDLAEEVDEETFRMLRRTRHPEDPTTVYMQSDISFYDTFYTATDETSIDDKELLSEARGIRRVYKFYSDYLYAVYIRDLYIDAVNEKIGSNTMAQNLMIQNSGIWIPPEPIYSSKSDDYETGRYGIVDDGESDWDDEMFMELMEQMCIDREIDSSNIKILFDIATDPHILAQANLADAEYVENTSKRNSVNLADIDELQKIFRGWYKDDKASQSKENAQASELMNRAFSKTPDNIRKNYYMSLIPNVHEEFQNAMNGITPEETHNPNEMVYYENKPMTRKEADSREFLKTLKEGGWGNTLRLMKLTNTGTSREYAMLRMQSKSKKKRNKKMSGSGTGIYGDKGISDYEQVSDLERLKAQLFLD